MFILSSLISKIVYNNDKEFIKNHTFENLARNFKFYKSQGSSDEEAEDLAFRFFLENGSN